MIRKLAQIRHVALTLILFWGSATFLMFLQPALSTLVVWCLITVISGVVLYSSMQRTEVPRRRSRAIRLSCVKWSLVAVGLFGFSYSLVPMYHLMCHGMGMHGSSMASAVDPNAKPRMLSVHLLHDHYRGVPVQLSFGHSFVTLMQGQEKKSFVFLKNASDQVQSVRLKTSMTEGLGSCLSMTLPFHEVSLQPHEVRSAELVMKRSMNCPTLAQGAWGVYVFDTKEVGVQGQQDNWLKMHRPYQPTK